ncbi:MAG: hypothetical protein HYX89_06610 [Chloroflexi bacterium]|nr:hypothetical protein [Chloroflexota bacterium]
MSWAEPQWAAPTPISSASDPSWSPARGQAQSLDVELVCQIGGTTNAVAIQGSYAYIGVGPRLVILDISNPASPVVIGQSPVLPDWVQGVAVSGSYAYVADYDYGLRIINVANPASPFEAGYYDTPGFAYGVALSGGYAYVADTWGGLLILRFTGEPAPTPTATATNTPTPTPTFTPTQTMTATATNTPTPTMTPTQYRVYLPQVSRAYPIR